MVCYQAVRQMGVSPAVIRMFDLIIQNKKSVYMSTEFIHIITVGQFISCLVIRCILERNLDYIYIKSNQMAFEVGDTLSLL